MPSQCSSRHPRWRSTISFRPTQRKRTRRWRFGSNIDGRRQISARRARLKPTLPRGLSKEDEVKQTIEEKNKAFVLEAFDTLFVKRDYAAAERFWAPNYIQHSAHIPPGREGLFNMIKGLPDG